jgi:hypothetical protein
VNAENNRIPQKSKELITICNKSVDISIEGQNYGSTNIADLPLLDKYLSQG